MKTDKEPIVLPDTSKQSVRAICRFGALGAVLFVIAAALHSAGSSIGGGDTWVAMACGRYSLEPWCVEQPGRTWQMRVLDTIGIHITQQDPFSAKSRPFEPGSRDAVGWVNQNWLTHVLFYKLKTLWGTEGPASEKGENLIVLYKFLQAIFTALFAYWTARKLGAHPALAAGTVAFAMLVSRTFIDMRPNISTIFFAAIMMYLLACWKMGQSRRLVWMIPLMLIWSNVHGGFIYAILVLGIMLAGAVASKLMNRWFRGSFLDRSWKEIAFLGGIFVATTWIPAIFSPFGLENLTHPFLVASGEEGKQWRQVSEWHPIYEMGYGNEKPYFAFLAILAFVMGFWLLWFCRRPIEKQPSRRNQEKILPETHWPTLDLSQWGVIAVTLWMSIQSRRFIFLGSVALSPYLAAMIQDWMRMMQSCRKGGDQPIKPPSARWEKRCAGLTWVGAAILSAIFAIAMWDTYYRLSEEGLQDSLFRQMVKIEDQPVEALAFLNANHIPGVVLNEWTQGGYVIFGQSPAPNTGSPFCKVAMDGRAQAAYSLASFQRYNELRPYVNPQNPAWRKQVALRTQILQNLLKQNQLSPDDPKTWDTLVQRWSADPRLYLEGIALSYAEPRLYSAVLKHEGITAVLFRKDTAAYLYTHLRSSGDWIEVYSDWRHSLLLRKGASENQEILRKMPEEWAYPSEEIRRRMTAIWKSRHMDKNEALAGLKQIMEIRSDFYRGFLYEPILQAASRLGASDLLWNYFLQQYRELKQAEQSGERFARKGRLQSLLFCCEVLEDMARKRKLPQDAETYRGEKELYRTMQQEAGHSLGRDWLW